MSDFEPARFGSEIAAILALAGEPPLVGGEANEKAREAMVRLGKSERWRTLTGKRREMASCCESGLWLWHGFLDESHRISQEIDTPTGSYWHALMHRREGDFENAKYWFRRAGRHAIFPQLLSTARASTPPEQGQAGSLTIAAQWDPYRFVDLVAAAVNGRSVDAQTQSLTKIAIIEWRLLFAHCFAAAWPEG